MKEKRKEVLVQAPAKMMMDVPRAIDIIRELVRDELIEEFRDQLEEELREEFREELADDLRREIEVELRPVIEEEVRRELAGCGDDEPDGLADLMYETWRDEQALERRHDEGREVGA